MSAIVAIAYGYPYGNYGAKYGSTGSYGTLSGLNYGTYAPKVAYVSSGYGNQGYSGYGGYAGYGKQVAYVSQQASVVPAAVQSTRSIQYVDVPSTYEAAQPLTVDVGPNTQPINFRFRSQSSPLNLEATHEGAQASYEETASQDEPHVRSHTVHRPVVQQLNEVITPYRKINQEIKPVVEHIESLISRGQQQQKVAYQPTAAYGAEANKVVLVQQQPSYAVVEAKQPAVQYVETAVPVTTGYTQTTGTGFGGNYATGFGTNYGTGLTGSYGTEYVKNY